jgi:hypothetical protein
LRVVLRTRTTISASTSRASGAGPFDLASEADRAGGEGQSSGDEKAHGDGGGVPAAGGEASKNAGLGGGFVEMEGLRVELGSKRLDTFLRHKVCGG